jgi:LytTr DNA-binding domain
MTPEPEFGPEVPGIHLRAADVGSGSTVLVVLQVRSANVIEGESALPQGNVNSTASVIRVAGMGSGEFEQALAEYVRQLPSTKEWPFAGKTLGAGDQLAVLADPEMFVRQAMPPRIAIRGKGKIFVLEPTDVITAEGRGNYVLLRASDRSYLVRESVSAVEAKLGLYGFVRIHRSTIVNKALVEEIHISTSGEMSLRMKGIDKEYSISEKFKGSVKLLASCWI